MRTSSDWCRWRTISAYTQGMGANLPGQSSLLCGQAIQVASCGSHSAGILQLDGVCSDVLIAGSTQKHQPRMNTDETRMKKRWKRWGRPTDGKLSVPASYLFFFIRVSSVANSRFTPSTAGAGGASAAARPGP